MTLNNKKSYFNKCPKTINQNNILDLHIDGTIITIVAFAIGYIIGIRKNKIKH